MIRRTSIIDDTAIREMHWVFAGELIVPTMTIAKRSLRI